MDSSNEVNLNNLRKACTGKIPDHLVQRPQPMQGNPNSLAIDKGMMLREQSQGPPSLMQANPLNTGLGAGLFTKKQNMARANSAVGRVKEEKDYLPGD